MAESEITVQEISTFYTPVANHLQAHIYKSVNTGLFLTSLVAASIVKFSVRMFSLFNKVLQNTGL